MDRSRARAPRTRAGHPPRPDEHGNTGAPSAVDSDLSTSRAAARQQLRDQPDAGLPAPATLAPGIRRLLRRPPPYRGGVYEGVRLAAPIISRASLSYVSVSGADEVRTHRPIRRAAR